MASPAYLQRHGTPQQPEELRSHECLLYEYQSDPSRWIFKRENRKVEILLSGRIQANNGDLLADAACAGLGLAYLPEFIAKRHVDAGNLIVILDAMCQEASAINAVLPARMHIPVKVRELLTLLSEDLSGQGGPQ